MFRIAATAMLAAFAFASGLATGTRRLEPTVVQVDPRKTASASTFPDIPTPAPVIAAPIPPPVPSYVQANLERQGYRVEPARKLMSLSLDGGQRVTIPVEGVEIHYVGRETY